MECPDDGEIEIDLYSTTGWRITSTHLPELCLPCKKWVWSKLLEIGDWLVFPFPTSSQWIVVLAPPPSDLVWARNESPIALPIALFYKRWNIVGSLTHRIDFSLARCFSAGLWIGLNREHYTTRLMTKLKLLDSLLQEVFIKKALAYYLYSGQKEVHKEKRNYSNIVSQS